jgi:hypothetical protein
MQKLSILVLFSLFFNFAKADYLVKGVLLPGPFKAIWKTEAVEKIPGKSREKRILRSLPKYIAEHSGLNGGEYQEIIYPENQLPEEMQSFFLQQDLGNTGETEVRVLVQQGPWKNRINFTIVGDGYLSSEKEKFFADAKRISEELFTAKTFKSFSALFNVSAVFVASRVSGLGDGQALDTAFKLYRTPKGSKRAIYPGDERALDAAIAKAPATSYPIVIANDDFYGGLGGKYSISTSSVRSGLIVLRHELGHSIGLVGEEYDDGQVYMGANSSRNSQTSWTQWSQDKISVFEATPLGGKYVWQDLAQGAFQMAFKTLGTAGELLGIDLSSVGWESPEDVKVSFDNQEIKFDGNFSIDRNFFFVGPVAGIAPGNHLLKIEERIKDGNNVLGFARVYSYPPTYDFSKNRIGAFATYDTNGSKSYRPTHDSCLMRNMQSEYFCVVDQENLWIQMLKRIRLIDSVTATNLDNGKKSVELKTLDLNGVNIHWSMLTNGNPEALNDFENQKSIQVAIPPGSSLKVEVQFSTPEVRKTKFSDTAILQ